MKAVEILKEEFEKEGMDIAEEVLASVVKIIGEKVLPRLAIEADESAVKAVAAIGIPVFKALEPSLLVAIDKLDGEVG